MNKLLKNLVLKVNNRENFASVGVINSEIFVLIAIKWIRHFYVLFCMQVREFSL